MRSGWWWIVVVACGPEPEVTVDCPAPCLEGDADADADSDADSDADTDTDADSDTGSVPWTGVAGSYVGDTDGRTWHLYVPTTYDPVGGSPLVVAFHGAGDSGTNFYNVAMTLGYDAAAESEGFLFLVPDTTSPYSDFANWSGDPNNDFYGMRDEMDAVLGLIDELGATWHLDPDQLHAMGFSNGGLFLAVGGMASADRYATLGVLGYGWGEFYIEAPSRALPVQFVVGSSDFFSQYAQQSSDFLEDQGHEVRLEIVSGVGHSFSGLTGAVPADDLAAWMLARPL